MKPANESAPSVPNTALAHGAVHSVDVPATNLTEPRSGINLTVNAGDAKKAKGENGDHPAKISENGHLTIKEGEDLVTEPTHNKEVNIRNAAVDGASIESPKTNNDGIVETNPLNGDKTNAISDV